MTEADRLFWMERLEPGERLLWHGRPQPGLRWRRRFVWTTVAGLASGGIGGILTFLGGAGLHGMGQAMLVFGPLLAVVAPVMDGHRRGDQRFGLTSRRALIHGPGSRFKAVRVHPGLKPRIENEVPPTIWFGRTRAQIRADGDAPSPNAYSPLAFVGFDLIDDAEAVRHLIATETEPIG